MQRNKQTTVNKSDVDFTLQVGETWDTVTAECLYHKGSKLEVRSGFKTLLCYL